MDGAISGRSGMREWAGLGVLALPTVLLGLDVTVLYLALPSLAKDLRPGSAQELWILDVYGFFIAGFLITMGTLGDRIGRRRLLMIGAAAFGGASVLAAYSTSAEMLILARAILGIAGATLMPSTLALISNMFSDARQRALAIGVWATMFAIGMAAGPLVGGALLEHFWWGSAFLIAVPIVALVLVAAPFILPEYRARDSNGRFDLPSVALSLAAILPVVYAVKHAAASGLDAMTVLIFISGVIFGVVFVRRQRSLVNPLLDMKLFANRAVSVALGILLIGLVSVGGVMYLVTQHLQLVSGLSPLAAGAWMGPPALMMFIAAIAAPLISRRIRPGFVVAGTLALSTIGYMLLAQVEPSDGIAPVVVGFALVYLGLGTIVALGTDLVVGAAPPQKAGSASAMSEMVQELGIAVGVAVLGSMTTAVYRSCVSGMATSDLPNETERAVRDSMSGATSVADSVPDEILRQSQEAFVSGMNVSTLAAGISILALAVLSAIALRHIGTIGGEGYAECDSKPDVK